METLSKSPQGKYNPWCLKRPLVYKDQERKRNADQWDAREDLTYTERSVFFVRELVGCEGIEFVAFSSVRLDSIINLPGNVTLVPCFLPDWKSATSDDPLVSLSEQMEKKARYIYDGWIPITSWGIESIRLAFRNVDRALSLFSLLWGGKFSWELKYKRVMRPDFSSFMVTEPHLTEIKWLSSLLDSLNEEDASALYRSIGWLSQALQITEPAGRFLFCIVVIESLASYIENESKDASAFAPFRSSKSTKEQRLLEKQECIQSVLDNLYQANRENAIRTAYFDCVVGIKKSLERHLAAIFGQDSQVLKLLFHERVDGKTLYEIRHDIAHGRIDALSQAQKNLIENRVGDAESIARGYILTLLRQLIGKPIFEKPVLASVMFPLEDAVMSDHALYDGPIHMAQLYIHR